MPHHVMACPVFEQKHTFFSHKIHIFQSKTEKKVNSIILRLLLSNKVTIKMYLINPFC